jgi:hypothetical protein
MIVPSIESQREFYEDNRRFWKKYAGNPLHRCTIEYCDCGMPDPGYSLCRQTPDYRECKNCHGAIAPQEGMK